MLHHRCIYSMWNKPGRLIQNDVGMTAEKAVFCRMRQGMSGC